MARAAPTVSLGRGRAEGHTQNGAQRASRQNSPECIDATSRMLLRLDILAINTATLRAQQVQKGPADGCRRRYRVRIFGRIGRGAHGRAHAARIHAVDSNVRFAVEFLGQHAAHRLPVPTSRPRRLPKMGAGSVTTPLLTKITEASADFRRLGSSTCVKMNGAVRFTCSTLHQVGTSYCSSGVRSPSKRGGMHHAVEFAELVADGCRQIVVFDGCCGGEVQHRDRRLRGRAWILFHRRPARAWRRCGPTRSRSRRRARIRGQVRAPRPPPAPVIRITRPASKSGSGVKCLGIMSSSVIERRAAPSSRRAAYLLNGDGRAVPVGAAARSPSAASTSRCRCAARCARGNACAAVSK